MRRGLYQLLSKSGLSTLGPADLLSLLEELSKQIEDSDNLDQDGHVYSVEAQQVFEARALHSFTSAYQELHFL